MSNTHVDEELGHSIYAEMVEREEDRESREKRERQARLDKAAQERLTFELKFYEPILAEVRRQLVAMKEHEGKVLSELAFINLKGPRLVILGVDATWLVDIVEERAAAGRSYMRGGYKTGKIRLSVGDYGSKQSYPQRKDGTHNYEAIAGRLIAHVEKQLLKDEAEAQRKRNESAAARVRDRFGMSTYDYAKVEASQSPTAPVHLKYAIAGSFTEERAIEIIEALKSVGLKVSYNAKG